MVAIERALATAVIIVLLVFWAWMLIDCLERKFKDRSSKIAWALVILFGHVLGALIYYLVVCTSPAPQLDRRTGKPSVFFWWELLVFLIMVPAIVFVITQMATPGSHIPILVGWIVGIILIAAGLFLYLRRRTDRSSDH